MWSERSQPWLDKLWLGKGKRDLLKANIPSLLVMQYEIQTFPLDEISTLNNLHINLYN